MARASSSRRELAEARLPVNPGIVCLGHALKETLEVKLARKSLEMAVKMGGGRLLKGMSISDGGDGFLDAFSEFHDGGFQRVVTTNPLGKLATTEFFLSHDGTIAAIEVARCAGLSTIPKSQRDLMNSGSGSVGHLLARAVGCGAKEIHIGLGGSATCDGGVGMLVRMREERLYGTSNGINICARHLDDPPEIDFAALREWLGDTKIIAYCDVSNPLLGRRGTAQVFAPQKGANQGVVEILEEGMERWADQIENAIGERIRDDEGVGAAGGMGFALAALGARLVPGARTFCELAGVPALLSEADLVVTCEGRFDKSSLDGKAPWTAAQMAVNGGSRGLILAGVAEADACEEALEQGINVVEFSRDAPPAQLSALSFNLLSRGLVQFLNERT